MLPHSRLSFLANSGSVFPESINSETEFCYDSVIPTTACCCGKKLKPIFDKSVFTDPEYANPVSVHSNTAGSGSVIIKTVHFIGTCLEAGGTKECSSPALSECGVMSQQTVSPQASAQPEPHSPAQPVACSAISAACYSVICSAKSLCTC